MDRLYSLSLLVSLAAGGLAVVLSVIEHYSVRASTASGLARGISLLVMLAFVALLVSFFVHLNWGHGPQSREPMSFVEFVRGHRAFGVGALMAIAAAVLHFLRPKAGR